MFRPSRYLAFFTVAALFGFPIPAQAQMPDSLEEALRTTTDRANRRVPLLIIEARQARITQSSNDRADAYYQHFSEGRKPLLTDVIRFYNRELASCGSVQIAAPLLRDAVNAYPGKPEEWAQIGRERASRLLFGSLSPAQWNTASSLRGLSLSDLRTPEQKAWFLSAIPAPFTVVGHMVGSDGETDYSPGNTKTATMSTEQVRIRVVREMGWMYKRGKEDGLHGGWGGEPAARQPGQRYWSRTTGATETETAETYQDNLRDAILAKEPNRFQKGDLSFNTAPLYGKRVLLDGAKTLGELVIRIAEATSLELYADRRISGLSVTVLGDAQKSVDAADLLKALCLATTGTVRAVTDPETKVTVYLLCARTEGTVLPRMRLAEWGADVVALVSTERTAFAKTTRNGGVASGVRFDADAVATISDDVMAQAEARLLNPDPKTNIYGRPAIPVSALSPAAQEKVRRDMVQQEKYNPNATSYDYKTVYADFSLKTQFVTDEYGTFSGSWLASLDSVLPRKPVATVAPKLPTVTGAVALPPAPSFAALKANITNASEARTAIDWARKHGFNALFVPVSLWDDAAPEAFEQIVDAAKASGIKMFPVVSLLKVSAQPDDTDPSAKLTRARNVFGESLHAYAKRREGSPAMRLGTNVAQGLAPLLTHDWLDASDADVRKTVSERLAKIAAVPGIAGIVLGDVAAPGTAFNEAWYVQGSLAGQFAGYGESSRVAFIRQENADPLDLLPNGNMEPNISWNTEREYAAPFAPQNDHYEVARLFQFTKPVERGADGVWKPRTRSAEEETDPERAWRKLLARRNREQIGAIRKAAVPETLPVMIEAPPSIYYSSVSPLPYVAPWLPGEMMPETPDKTALFPTVMRRESNADSVRRGVTNLFKSLADNAKKPNRAGFVIDTTAKPLPEALSLLSVITTMPGD
ncbi:MAG: hypothetical protein H7Y38_18305 [Armatimonadetes bacterium]|nr:hypothetical protein [Armatimonadota bacterium]